MFRPSRNFKVPQVFGGQWKDHQTFQKWDPISKRLVQVNCCGPIITEGGGGEPTGPTGPVCPDPDPADSVTLSNLTSTGGDVSFVYSGPETVIVLEIYESATLPVDTSGSPLVSFVGELSTSNTYTFTTTLNNYYAVGLRIRKDCGGGEYTYSTYVYSETLQYEESPAVWTFNARDSNRSWTGVASSNDGTKLVACVSGGQIYTSTDSGVSWTARDSNRLWAAVASSSDGTNLVACVTSGQLYTSTDSGATWTARDSNRSWTSVASSSNGTKLVASESGGLYTSTDSGATWTAHETSRIWVSVASSSDGTKLLAAESGGRLFTSTDSGANWTMGSIPNAWVQVASSADGSVLVATPSFDNIYVSTNSGATWTTKDSARDWYGVTCSSDGSVMAAVVNTGQIYISQDTGNTWTAYESNRSWSNNCIALSGTGTLLAAGVTGGKMYIGIYA